MEKTSQPVLQLDALLQADNGLVGELPQDADGVIFLHCNSYYNQERPDPWEPDYMQIILAKNRHASTGTCDAAFYRAVGRIIPAR